MHWCHMRLPRGKQASAEIYAGSTACGCTVGRDIERDMRTSELLMLRSAWHVGAVNSSACMLVVCT